MRNELLRGKKSGRYQADIEVQMGKLLPSFVAKYKVVEYDDFKVMLVNTEQAIEGDTWKDNT